MNENDGTGVGVWAEQTYLYNTEPEKGRERISRQISADDMDHVLEDLRNIKR